mgnify:CR=1 FL=1
MITLSDAHQKFLDFLKSHKRASATIVAYGKDIAQLVDFLAAKAVRETQDVKKQDLDDFLNKLTREGYTPKSVSRKINSLKTFFRFLKDEGYLVENPSGSITHPKFTTKPPRILSKLEYRALRDACRGDIRMSAVVEVLLQTGIRIGELANLKTSDIKDTTLYVTPMENRSGREIPLNKAAKQALDKYLNVRPSAKEPSLFITKTGRCLLIRNIRTAIDRYFRLADIKSAKVNDLRHTFVAHHLLAGTPVTVVAKLAGHKRLSTTEKYLDLIKDQMEEKVKLEEL